MKEKPKILNGRAGDRPDPLSAAVAKTYVEDSGSTVVTSFSTKFTSDTYVIDSHESDFDSSLSVCASDV